MPDRRSTRRPGAELYVTVSTLPPEAGPRARRIMRACPWLRLIRAHLGLLAELRPAAHFSPGLPDGPRCRPQRDISALGRIYNADIAATSRLLYLSPRSSLPAMHVALWPSIA